MTSLSKGSFKRQLLKPSSLSLFLQIDLDLWDLDDVEIRLEWFSIDILIIDGQHQLAVIIENKIDSGEHDDQLKRYRQIVNQHYPRL